MGKKHQEYRNANGEKCSFHAGSNDILAGSFVIRQSKTILGALL
jgi:hypothetical protein